MGGGGRRGAGPRRPPGPYRAGRQRSAAGSGGVGRARPGRRRARNLADKPVWRAVSVTGVPATPLPAARSQMRVTRQFETLDGQPLDLDHLKQNTVFVLVLEGKAEDGQAHRAMVQHGLPAGWEIAGRLGGGDVPGMAWLGKLSRPRRSRRRTTAMPRWWR